MKKLYASLALAVLAGIAAAAPAKVEMCIGCHGIPGYKAAFPEVFQVPMIGGQSAKYIESALKAYQKGDRKHPTMRGVAASLSEQDIAAVAAYYAQRGAQPGQSAAQPGQSAAQTAQPAAQPK
jgi:cytochrome c553